MTPDRLPNLWKRLVWFAAIWLCSILALGVVAYAIRWAIN